MMKTPAAPTDSARGEVAAAARELARIEQQTDHARAHLAKLLKELETAQTQQGQSQAVQLLEANEQLVLATLNSQKVAEISERALREAMEAEQPDALTELPNRLLLLRSRLALAVADAKHCGGGVALLLMRISNFKEVLDLLGPAVGDQVLRHAAQCLSSAAGPQATVSRHGNVEFLIVLPDVPQALEAEAMAEKLIAALGVPAHFKNHEISLIAKVGVSMYPQDGEQVDSLIDKAVAAMYRAKLQNPASDTLRVRGGKAGNKLTLAPRALASVEKPVVQRYTSLAEQALHLADVQEANTELLVAALGARGLVEAAASARRQQAVFLGILAHELRNPLTPLRNAAALLSRIHSGEPLLGQVQAIIDRQLRTLSRLVGDLLDLSRANAGKLRIEKHPVEMTALIDEVVSACWPAMDARLQHFDVQLLPYPVEVDGDAVRLTQILTNLLDNASKYTPEGGQIGLSIQTEGDWLVLTVYDNGIGITAKALPNIFEPFVQDAHATALDQSGLGIGLTVVRDLVEAHGGQVQAKSDGKMLGSVFTVRLPLSAKETELS